MKRIEDISNWYCQNCNIKYVPRSYRDMNAEFTVSDDIIRSVDNVIAIKKIQPHERELAIQLAIELQKQGLPLEIVAVECSLCGNKTLVPKFGAIEPSRRVKRQQFQTVSRISKEATVKMRTQIKKADGRSFFQKYPIWLLLLGGSFFLTVIAFILSSLHLI